ncbi:unnamed protein product [Clonostachys rhizophaga]|uniref:Zn(2)-C6 fungal-type domain-containing protein n=1 Tax=Clonostachys rhizophaga TaxID=160324 RepID=A0A9N9YQZ0_9HYPO|nr:unnamed protein product [Clonostachys rhizophaga]
MASTEAQPAPKRASQRKVRTPCLTCKIRRVRCDQQKPECNRCVSTGRKCDGYSDSSITPSPEPPSSNKPSQVLTVAPSIRPRQLAPAAAHPAIPSATDGRLSRPVAVPILRRDPRELEVYQYFINVAAPSIAGTFDTDFWLREIPQFCLADPAIWHAVTALGSLCRDYDFKSPDPASSNTFALNQHNAAISHLTRSRSMSSKADRWRTLVASTIFTCISVVQGSYKQAQMHFQAGHKLFLQLQAEEQAFTAGRASKKMIRRDLPSVTPVTFQSVRSILIAFQIHEQKLDMAEVVGAPNHISAEDDSFGLWRTYTAPPTKLDPAFTPERSLAPMNLILATRASESLMWALVYFMGMHLAELTALHASGQLQLPSLAARQKLHLRCYKEIESTLHMFEKALGSGEGDSAWSPTVKAQIGKAVQYLHIYKDTIRLIFHKDPHEPNPFKRLRLLPGLCESIVNRAEHVLLMEAAGIGRGDGSVLIPSPALTNPLAFVVQCGFGYATRRRALNLLYQPRLDGIWDTVMSASLMQAALDLELSTSKAYWARKAAKGIALKPIAIGTGVEEIETGAHPLFRLFAAVYGDKTQRGARVALRTWQEWIDGEPGRWVDIHW